MSITPSRLNANRTRATRPTGLLLAACLLPLCAVQIGCVSRRLTIRSDPPGAMVLLDGEEMGRTPVSGDFTYYGTREITLIKDGFETLTTLQEIRPPWYQRVPFDAISDNLLPYRVTDRHDFTYKLRKQRVPRIKDLMNRANGLRGEAQTGQ